MSPEARPGAPNTSDTPRKIMGRIIWVLRYKYSYAWITIKTLTDEAKVSTRTAMALCVETTQANGKHRFEYKAAATDEEVQVKARPPLKEQEPYWPWTKHWSQYHGAGFFFNEKTGAASWTITVKGRTLTADIPLADRWS